MDFKNIGSTLNNPTNEEEFNFRLVECFSQLSDIDIKMAHSYVLSYCSKKSFKMSNEVKEIFKNVNQLELKPINRYESIPDAQVAKKYLAKISNATSRNIEFTLSFFDMKKLLNRKTCAYTKAKFTSDNPLSLDRIDNTLGYIKGNVISVSHKANQYKENIWESTNIQLTKNQRLSVMKAILEQNGYTVSK